MTYALYQLVRRYIKLFLKDRMTVFFAFFAPLIVLGLYVLFIGRMQVDGILSALQEAGITGLDKQVKALCDAWMFSGVMGVSCITVSFTAGGVRVQDVERGVYADTMSSPVRNWVVTLSYFISNAIITLAVCFLVLLICLVWTAAAGHWYMTFGDVAALFGVTVLSVLSATMFTLFITSFLRTESAQGALTGILSAMVGFLTGAFMPISTFPKAIQYFTLLVPGSYSSGLFRQFFMGGVLNEMAVVAPPGFADGLSTDFSMQMDFFGATMHGGGMAIALAVSVAILGGLNLLVLFLRGKHMRLLPKNSKKTKKV